MYSRSTRAQLILAVVALIATAGCGGNSMTWIVGATVIDPGSGEVLSNHCVGIEGDRITRVEPCESISPSGEVVDAGGRWLIPGLWDMHVHALWDPTVYRAFFDDFVRYGVVGVRDMGGSVEILAEARDYLEDPSNFGPELIAAGRFLDGPEPLIPEFSESAGTFEEGAAAVARIEAAGGDFVKLYTQLPADAALGALDEAGRRGLRVVGHLPGTLDLDAAIDAGLSGIEHMAVEIGGLCDVDDPAACPAVLARLTEAGVHLTPTLLIRRRRALLDHPEIAERGRLDEMPSIVADDWRSRQERRLADTTPETWEAARAQYAREARLTIAAISAGAPILVGTDAGDLFVPPGSSLHDELILLVESGMSEMEALAAATVRSADFLGLEDRGRVRPGAIADLVILTRDPLENIRNTRAIETVFLRGRIAPRR